MIGGLYLVTDENHDGRLLERVFAALKGGTAMVQYRCKAGNADLEAARAIAAACRDFKVPFLVNDSVELALACDADGVHLGQGDQPAVEARRLLGPGKLLGVSAHTVEQALKAEMQGADYLGVGTIFPTQSKDDAHPAGLAVLKKIRMAVKIPLIAIGGIAASNCAEVIAAGADGVAVISAVMGDPRPGLAAREIALQFNANAPLPRGRVLTIAGSDSGGGAGIQADLKTITLLGAYGMSALTALTAQNTRGVRGVHPCPHAFVADQIEMVLSDIGADTIKTGMLFSADIVALVAEAIERHTLLAVVDPVMIAKGGAPLLQQDAVEVLRQVLLPQTYLLTPNLPEAEALSGVSVESEADMERALFKLREMGPRNVLLKGGHLDGEAVDLLLAGDTLHRFPAARIATRNTHGTGCTYSAAIATFLAQGLPLVAAVGRAKLFINEAIRTSTSLGSGHGPVNHWQAAKNLS
ncbi:bifunctional hydroxymethylpyrimidine kinase/phosphomethylpyrimidine kinase [Desulfuromonas carbonis]|uniref:bifunctional hydroxymethylpyrimidine kinase/phosphomethylpyrimidine kinase n=1 Tax=Desulfuromonas sp. DDH964 TaxID=1823759 RepID=UPI00078CE4CB|nr:bifunctional hydroxymethylpyrimidine kinase/phosphomethylpyrimidine kinase [Desulfuromonas sp. DDH964]AMV73170.1 4-amino-5-hydroxymethyl-2-methylpyrimidine- phosphate kinase and thiamin monophosphate synthase [Desulfuromonas sp. DDH964]